MFELLRARVLASEDEARPPPAHIQFANRVVGVALVVATCASAIIDLVWVSSSMPTLGWALMLANSFYLARYLFRSARGQRVSWFQAHYPPNDELRLFNNDLEWTAIGGAVLFTAMSIAVVCGVLPPGS
jgi:Flp pilus assembly protein TadB